MKLENKRRINSKHITKIRKWAFLTSLEGKIEKAFEESKKKQS